MLWGPRPQRFTSSLLSPANIAVSLNLKAQGSPLGVEVGRTGCGELC